VRCELAGITWYQRTLAVRLPLFGVSCRLARCGPWTPHGTMAPPPRNAAA